MSSVHDVLSPRQQHVQQRLGSMVALVGSVVALVATTPVL